MRSLLARLSVNIRNLFPKNRFTTGHKQNRTVSLEWLQVRQLFAYDIELISPPGVAPEDVEELNGNIYFSSADDVWKSDGTASGTALLVSFGSLGNSQIELDVLNDQLVLGVQQNNNLSLYKSDGTASGTALVKDLGEGFGFYSEESIEAAGGKLYFTNSQNATGSELWVTDLTNSGTVNLTENITPGPYNAVNPSYLTEFNGELYFTGQNELWKSDGTESGTVIVSDVNGFNGTTAGSYGAFYTYGLSKGNGELFFAASDFNSTQLWKSDGTESGSMLVSDLGGGGYLYGGSGGAVLAEAGGKLFFSFNSTDTGAELWASDGTESGTTLVADIAPGSASSYPAGLTEFQGEIFFNAFVPSGTSSELWKSDGTASGTVLVSDQLSSGFYDFAEFQGRLYFMSGTESQDLWSTDGSTAELAIEDAQEFTYDMLATDNALLLIGPSLSAASISGFTPAVDYQFRSDTFTVTGSWTFEYTETGYVDNAAGTFTMSGGLDYTSPTDGTGFLNALGAPEEITGSGADLVNGNPCSEYTVLFQGSLEFDDTDGNLVATSGTETLSTRPTYNDLTGGFCPETVPASEYSLFNNIDLFDGEFDEANNSTLSWSGSKSLLNGTATQEVPAVPVQFDETNPTDLTISAPGNSIVMSVSGVYMDSGGTRSVPVTSITGEFLDINGVAIGGSPPFSPVDVFWNSSQITIDTTGLIFPPNAVSLVATVDPQNNIGEASELNNSVTIVNEDYVNLFLVDSIGDQTDTNLSDNVCQTALGTCTLRAAIEQANATANGPGGPDEIAFDIPAGEIAPGSQLPTISEAVFIDATTQPGSSPGTPAVTLDGSLAGGSADGFFVNGTGSTISGFVIKNFGGNGVNLHYGGSHTVTGNWIGTDSTGNSAAANGGGILAFNSTSNLIGGDNLAARNVVSGNNVHGVFLRGVSATNNRVTGNYIGVNASGSSAVGNGGNGVLSLQAPMNQIGGTASGEGNLISGNVGYGVQIFDGGGNSIEGNKIGTDASGNSAIANQLSGVLLLQTSNESVGGDASGAGNLISGNAEYGVYILGASSSGNTVSGNRIGTDAAGLNSLGNTASGIYVTEATGNTIGGATSGAGNIVSGNGQHGVYLNGTTSPENVIQGNYIGLDANGNGTIGNSIYGLLLVQASGTLIGGSTTGAGNVISGNTSHGVFMVGVNTTDNEMIGNLVGTDATGNLDRGNGGHGVLLIQAPGNTIGGSSASSANTVSGNDLYGVEIYGSLATGNTISGNRIGTNASGDTPLQNRFSGVLILDAPGNTIGGDQPGEGNVLSGNGQYGAFITGALAQNNLVEGNFIGTDSTGTSSVPNVASGVLLISADNNTIGGTAPEKGNVISGNSQHGVYLLNSTSNTVSGNLIGTTPQGDASLANVGMGMLLINSDANTIGGTVADARNVLSGNGKYGMQIYGAGSTDNAIEGNFIGLGSDGSTDVGNTQGGILVVAATNNTFGGSTTGAGNVISGNDGYGVYLVTASTTENNIYGNLIGTDVSGMADRGNQSSGIFINGAPGNNIGGSSPGQGNVISGNNQHGIYISGFASTNTVIQQNLIGTDILSTSKLGNTGIGVLLIDATTTVGGPGVDEGNVISGNGQFGVLITGGNATGSSVVGNRVGRSIDGNTAVGNGLSGVVISSVSDITITGNTLASNSKTGVSVLGSSQGVSIESNSFFINGSIGIDLNGDGFTDNDAALLDSDTGPNQLQNFPVFTSATLSGSSLTVDFSVPSATSSSAYDLNIQFYKTDVSQQEGQTLLGSTTYLSANAGANQQATLDVTGLGLSIGNHIVAIATDQDGNTSEFSTSISVESPPPALFFGDSPSGEKAPRNAMLSNFELERVIRGAIARFDAAGLGDAQLDALRQVRVGFEDLRGDLLAWSHGNKIHLDLDAAGHGWFADKTPMDDVEFESESKATHRVDLLSAVMLEMGHVLGLRGEQMDATIDGLTLGELEVGTRSSFTENLDSLLSRGDRRDNE